MSSDIAVIRLAPSLKNRAAEALAAAFSGDPTFVYTIPDAEVRRGAVRRFFNAAVDYAMHFGEVYTNPEVSGAACWLPPGGNEASLWRMLRTGFALPRAVLAMPAESRRRMSDFMNYNDAVHARVIKRPHWYLSALGVAPDFQRRGIGGALLAPVLARADAAGTACYLETQTEDNTRFYTRYGFAVVEKGEVPGHGWPMWAMLREPARGPRESNAAAG